MSRIEQKQQADDNQIKAKADFLKSHQEAVVTIAATPISDASNGYDAIAGRKEPRLSRSSAPTLEAKADQQATESLAKLSTLRPRI